jgi:DNA-binding transcriptional MerR regulator
MKNQIQLMKINNEMYYHCNDLFNGDKNYNSNKIKYILLIKSFTSESTSIEELKKIFKQSNIDVIFTYELFTDKLLDLNVTEKLTYSELLEENKKLKELLKKFEDKK